MEYRVIGPQGRTFAMSDSWVSAVEKATAMSLRWRYQFRVGSPGQLTFKRERLRVLKAADSYIQEYWKCPTGQMVGLAKLRFDKEKAILENLIDVSIEPLQDYLNERHLATSHYPARPSR